MSTCICLFLYNFTKKQQVKAKKVWFFFLSLQRKYFFFKIMPLLSISTKVNDTKFFAETSQLRHFVSTHPLLRWVYGSKVAKLWFCSKIFRFIFCYFMSIISVIFKFLTQFMWYILYENQALHYTIYITFTVYWAKYRFEWIIFYFSIWANVLLHDL